MSRITLLGLFVTVLVIASPGANGVDLGQSIKDSVNQVAGNINKAVDTIGSTTCIVSHREEFDQCNKRMEDYVHKDKVEKAEMKDFCCAYVAYRDCVEDIAKKRCGEKAADTVEVYMNAIKNKVMSDDCNNYNNVFDCMDQVVLFAVVIILAVVGIGIIIGLICVCKSCCC